MACYLWRGNDVWTGDAKQYTSDISALEADSQTLYPFIERALNMLEDLVRNDQHYLYDFDTALKSIRLDRDIDKVLYSAKVPSSV